MKRQANGENNFSVANPNAPNSKMNRKNNGEDLSISSYLDNLNVRSYDMNTDPDKTFTRNKGVGQKAAPPKSNYRERFKGKM